MAKLSRITSLTLWNEARWHIAKTFSFEGYGGSEWPERIGLNELSALQTIDTPQYLDAWQTALLSSSIPTNIEEWDRWQGPGSPVTTFEHKTVSPKDFADYLQEIGEQPSKYITAWFDAFGVDMATAEPIEPEPPQNKPRKKRIPQERDTNEGLLLITNLLDYYKIEYLDELPASKAWGKIVSDEFTSELIKNIGENKKHIMLKGDGKFSKDVFLERYRKRFK